MRTHDHFLIRREGRSRALASTAIAAAKIAIYRRANCSFSFVQVEGGITPEAEKTFENAEAVLDAAGATME